MTHASLSSIEIAVLARIRPCMREAHSILT
jgi:hypothetical protein